MDYFQLMSPPITIEIEYVDAKGNFSRRNVRIESVRTEMDVAYLDCVDLDIHENRTFRLDRVQYFIDGNGECLTPDEVFPELAQSAQQNTKSEIRIRITQEEPKPSGRGWTIVFWLLIVMIAALSFEMYRDQNSVTLGVLVFTIFAVPLFALRAVLRWIGGILRSRRGGENQVD